jgi:hypothetical protein
MKYILTLSLMLLAPAAMAHPIYPCHVTPGSCPQPDDHTAISHVEANLQAAIHSFEHAFGTDEEVAAAEQLIKMLEARTESRK